MNKVFGFVMRLGEVEYVEAILRNNRQDYPVAIIPEGPRAGAYCACDRCIGEYDGPDANSWGSYGYSHCLSSLDSPWAEPGEEEQSEAALREFFEAWKDEHGE